MEDYKERYEQILAKAKAIHNLASETSHTNTRMAIEELFPELKETDDEKIRKSLIGHLKECRNNTRSEVMLDEYAKWIVWLEKQGEQKPINKVEPKFKVGDYIVNEHGFVMQIDGIDSNTYIYHVLDNTDKKLTYDITKTDKSCHLWTIKDAKDGDIITSHKIIILFKKFQENGLNCSYVIAYGGIDMFGKLHVTDGEWMISNDAKPATKEQRDLLFSKMKEAGYKWNSKKKELNKNIKQKPVELTEICNYLECQKREEYSRKNILDKWIVFLKSLNIEEAATEGAMVQINRVLNVLDWAEKKGRLSHSDWEDCYTIIASLKYRLKK